MARSGRVRLEESRVRHFVLELPVLYRAAGEHEWHGGVTEDISASSVVIRADEETMPDDSVTVIISLPSTPAESGACLVARGRVTRPFESSSRATDTFGVEVARYRMHRRASARRRRP